MYTPEAIVEVHPFICQPDGQEVIIGNSKTGVYLAVAPEAVEILNELANGRTVGEISSHYQEDHGEIPDIDGLLSVLEAKGFISPPAGGLPDEDVGSGSGRDRAPGQAVRQAHYHFASFPRPLAEFLFGRFALASYCSLIVLAAIAMLLDHSLVPRRSDLYFPNDRTLSILTLTFWSYVGLFLHEFSHLVAAKAVGVNSRMGFGRRLWVIVAETDITGLWGIPKSNRYLPLFAGSIVDLVSAALLILILYASDQHWMELSLFTTHLMRALIFVCLTRILWQFCLFVRTDFYYVLAIYFNCKNLLKDTQAFLRNQLAVIFPSIRVINQSTIPASERRVIRVYAGLWILGQALAFAGLFGITLPICFQYIRGLAAALRVGYSANPASFTDALLFSSLALVPAMVGMMLWIGNIFHRERSYR